MPKNSSKRPSRKVRVKQLPWTSRRESAPGVVMRMPRLNRRKGK